ncbi:MAG: hypothetical protein ABEJ68_05255 [Halobacteriaceae archaeon]
MLVISMMEHDADSSDASQRMLTGIAARLESAVAEYPDAPDECTIYPADATDEALMTTWISAEEGSFVDLDEMR